MRELAQNVPEDQHHACRRTCCRSGRRHAVRSVSSPPRSSSSRASRSCCCLRSAATPPICCWRGRAPGARKWRVRSGARREAVARRAAAPDRKPRARPVWRGARRRHGGLGNAGVECVAADARAGDPHLVPDRRGWNGPGGRDAARHRPARSSSVWPRRCSSRVSLRSTCARRSSTEPRSRVRNILMAAEVALAVVVLLVAGAVLSKLQRHTRRRSGIRPRWCPARRIRSDRPAGRRGRHAALRGHAAGEAARSSRCSRCRDCVGGAARHPWPAARASSASKAGRATRPRRTRRWPTPVTPGYFEVMGIPLLAGEGFRRSRRSCRTRTGHRQ